MTSQRAPTNGSAGPARANSIQLQPLRHNADMISPSGILRRMRLKHPEEEPPEQVIADIYPQVRKRSQKEQDEEDEKARKRAMKNLVSSWQERLQLISLITTFFASIEAGMLVPLNTAPNLSDASAGLIKTANAGLLGALIMHVYAAVLSFLGAFLLIRYKLKEASKEEYIADMSTKGIRIVTSPENGSLHVQDIETGDVDTQGPDSPTVDLPQTHADMSSTDPQYERAYPARRGTMHTEPPIFSTDPHLEQVGFWSPTISSHMLSRVHSLCIVLAGVGFVLAIMGIIFYAWALQPKEVSILATAFLSAGIVATFVAIFLPDDSMLELIIRHKRKPF